MPNANGRTRSHVSPYQMRNLSVKKPFQLSLPYNASIPRVFHEYDVSGMPVHYNADTCRTEKGVFYTDNGFWDTYRTVYPLLSILMPDRVREMIEGFINYAEETGWLPKWLSPGEFGLMPGTLVEAVIADACVKGIVDGDLRKRAYRVLFKKRICFGRGNAARQDGFRRICQIRIRTEFVPRKRKSYLRLRLRRFLYRAGRTA